jgi:predicted RNA methylase
MAERSHYSEASSQAKLATVRQWLSVLAPDTVLDLGCNTGEFSRAALDSGARVIAVDGDHDSVQHLYQQVSSPARLYPVVANLADLHGGRGWNASEHPGLPERLAGQADLTLMLALTHHLHFSESIPLAEIAAFAAQMTKSHLVLELLPEADPMVQRLARQRRRPTADFTLDQQLNHFAPHFELVERQALPESGRQLALLRKRA